MPNFFQKHGFTLLELAVVLVIASLMVGFMLKVLQSKPASDCYEQTRVEMADIQASIENFVRTTGRYPKPANAAYGSNNPEFGTEASSGNTTASSATIGALPIAALHLGNGFADDCWGYKYTYAVTTNLTTTAGFNGAGLGTLTIKNGPLASPISTLSSAAAYALISHGEDKSGGTPMSANTLTVNGCDVTGTKIDTENCDVTAATSANTTFFTAAFNNGTGANFFDDLIVFAEKAGVIHTDCPAGSVMWNTYCGVTFSSITPHGTAYTDKVSSVPPSTANYAGKATLTCNEGTFVTSATSCASGLTPLCYEVDSTPGMCGNYHYTSGSTITDSVPCDYSGITPPSGWSWCSGGATGCDNGLSEDQGYCDAGTCYRCCGTVSQTYVNSYGAPRALASGACSWTGGPSGCAAGSRNWNGGLCSSTYGALTEGASTVMTNTIGEPGYSGSSTATCSAGTVSFSGESCDFGCSGGCVVEGMCLQEGDYLYKDASCVRQVCCGGSIQNQVLGVCPSGDSLGSGVCH